MSALGLSVALVGAGAGALIALLAGAAGMSAAALGAAAALFAGIALTAQPFLGVAALTAFSHLDAVQKLLFAFLLPVSAFKLITAATLAAFVPTAHRLRAHVHEALREPVIVLWLVFLALGAVSTVGSEHREAALASLDQLFSFGLLMALVVLLADTRRKVQALLWTLVATSLVSAAIVLIDFAFGVQLVALSEAATTARTVEGVTRSAGGSDHNPTTAASLLLVGVVFALVQALERPRLRLPLLVLVGVGTAAVVLSFARSAALAYGAIALALVWRHRRSRHLPAAGAAALLAALAALPLVPDAYWERMAAILGGAPDPTLGRRLSYNLIGIDLFLQRPLLGIGPGNFFHHFTDTDHRFMPGRTPLGRELHNMYLSVLVQHGLIGAAPFFAMLAISLRNLRRILADPVDPAMRADALALGHAFAAYLLTCLFLPSEQIKYTWLLMGLATALHLVNRRERARE